MMLRVVIAACLVTGCLAAQDGSCLNPVGDYITARDIARAIPQFSVLPAGKIVASSPAIGGKRTFRPDEIHSLAGQHGIAIDAKDDVCFAWELAPVNRSDVLAALRKSLDDPAAAIEITDLMADRAPRGKIEFPLANLGVPASLDQPATVLWRGDVLYGDTRRFNIWVRVRITAPETVVVAREKLEAGRPISASQLRTEIRQRFPVRKNKLTSIERVVGMMPLRTVAQGAELGLDALTWPNDVNRGDLIDIEARDGSIKLVFMARAESSGRAGDFISVRNPDTQKVFQARICARRKAIVEPNIVRDTQNANEFR